MNEWWKTFFDQDYLRIWGQMFSEEANRKQAAELWSMLDLNPGRRLLDAPCGWGRLSRPLALLGAAVLGVDQSETLLALAECRRGELPPERLRYLRHDLRTPLPETGFDVACNIFSYLQLIRVWNGRGGRGHLPNIARRRQAGWQGTCGDEPSRLDVYRNRARFKGIETAGRRHSFPGRTRFRPNFRGGASQLVLVWPSESW